MSKQQELETRLSLEFRPHFMAIENESHMHSSGRGDSSHFKVVIVSDVFEGMSKVARHRKIYQFFSARFAKRYSRVGIAPIHQRRMVGVRAEFS